MKNKLAGTGTNPEFVANAILRLGFNEGIDITPMKLQKLLFFVTCLYQRRTGRRLLTESFQPWKYGPVVRSVYDEFRGFGSKPITQYALDAQGKARASALEPDTEFTKAVMQVWENMKHIAPYPLSMITHREGSAWSQAVENGDSFISNTAMASDHTFDAYINEVAK